MTCIPYIGGAVGEDTMYGSFCAIEPPEVCIFKGSVLTSEVIGMAITEDIEKVCKTTAILDNGVELTEYVALKKAKSEAEEGEYAKVGMKSIVGAEDLK